MESASHARIDPVAVDGLEDVFAAANLTSDVSIPDTQSSRSVVGDLSHSQARVESDAVFSIPKSAAELSAERALATAQAIARCLDVRSEAVIEHHTIRKSPKNKKKKKTVEEWRIKWSKKKSDKRFTGTAGSLSEVTAVDPHERGLFDHVSELLRQNSELAAKLEAATYRIGYLEAELESLRSQAGFSDCDAQVAELPAPKPAIRAISERSRSSLKPTTADSKFSTSADFWDEEPVSEGAKVPSQKIDAETIAVEMVRRLVGEMLEEELRTAEQSVLEQPIVEQSIVSLSAAGSSQGAGLFNWLPPRA